jgi:hypothetical protein
VGVAIVDLVTHNEVNIAARPGAVWPHILDINGWHPAQILRHVGGPVEAVGERFSASPHQMPETVTLYVVTVELQPQRRRTVRLHSADERYLGYATWVLADRGEHTAVSYHVYCHQPVPQGMGNEELLQQTRLRMDLGLQNLKRLVETGRAAP